MENESLIDSPSSRTLNYGHRCVFVRIGSSSILSIDPLLHVVWSQRLDQQCFANVSNESMRMKSILFHSCRGKMLLAPIQVRFEYRADRCIQRFLGFAVSHQPMVFFPGLPLVLAKVDLFLSNL